MITNTEPALWTRAPTMGFRIPVMARTIAIKFKVIEKVMFSLMVVIISLKLQRQESCSYSQRSETGKTAGGSWLWQLSDLRCKDTVQLNR